MKEKLISALITLAALLTFFCTAAIAFDGNDYDYGGGGDDWGGSDWSSSDWGSSDYYSSSSSSELSASDLVIAIPIFVIILIVIIIGSKKKNGRSNSGNVRSGQGGGQGRNVILPDRTTQIETIIKNADPNFSAGDFITFTKQVYIDIEDAWCKRDLTSVRPVMHENLYNTTQKQVQSKIEQGVIYHYESIAINTAYLTSYIKDSQFEYLTAYLNARMIDYQTDEKTGNILRGDKTTRWDMRYKMKFVRSVGVTTKTETGAAQRHNCPNCGAPLEMASSGICDYCGSVVTTGQYSWVLTDFTTIRNDTVDEGIKVPESKNDNNNGDNQQ